LPACGIFCLILRADGQTLEEQNRYTLSGLKEVRLVVEADLPQELTAQMINESELQSEAELHLRRSGIPIAHMGLEALYVIVDAMKSTPGYYVFSVRAEFRQMVCIRRLERQGPSGCAPAYAPTWAVGVIGIAGPTRVSAIREAVGLRVDAFANAFLAVNPREAGAEGKK
jgi:hypothetical protein